LFLHSDSSSSSSSSITSGGFTLIVLIIIIIVVTGVVAVVFNNTCNNKTIIINTDGLFNKKRILKRKEVKVYILLENTTQCIASHHITSHHIWIDPTTIIQFVFP